MDAGGDPLVEQGPTIVARVLVARSTPVPVSEYGRERSCKLVVYNWRRLVERVLGLGGTIRKIRTVQTDGELTDGLSETVQLSGIPDNSVYQTA